MRHLMIAVLTVVAAAGAAIVLVEILHGATRRLGRRSELAADLARTAHRPFLATPHSAARSMDGLTTNG